MSTDTPETAAEAGEALLAILRKHVDTIAAHGVQSEADEAPDSQLWEAVGAYGDALDELDEDDEPDLSLADFKKASINPEILEETGEEWAFEEGCLSIPGIRGDVYRPETLRIRYRDLDWNEHEETYSGMAARIIQHEYDHLLGKLFVDYLPTLKKQFIKKKLTDISKGNVDADYRMRFPSRR